MDRYQHLKDAQANGATILAVADDDSMHVVGDATRKPQYTCEPERYVAMVPYAPEPQP